MPNSAAARDIAYYVRPQTRLRRHRDSGPTIIDHGEGAIVYADAGAPVPSSKGRTLDATHRELTA
jgi:hypothetical protein